MRRRSNRGGKREKGKRRVRKNKVTLPIKMNDMQNNNIIHN